MRAPILLTPMTYYWNFSRLLQFAHENTVRSEAGWTLPIGMLGTVCA